MPIRFFTAGESHGPRLTAIVEGIPAGIPLVSEDIDVELRRRQKGFGAGGRMRIESDAVEITAGVMNGQTTGAPIALSVVNRDYPNWREKDIAPMTTPRPGHADLTGAIKYGYRDLRLSLERASARETTMRVAVGAICKRFLGEFAIEVGGYVTQLGHVVTPEPFEMSYPERIRHAEESDVRCPLQDYGEPMCEAIRAVIKAQDTLGGVFEIVALGVPAGLGSYVHYERRLDARIAAAMLSIQAMKGVEIGPAFANAGKRGSEVHDAIVRDGEGSLRRATNRAGGIEGGISTGEAIIARIAMKPISTIVKGMPSVDLSSGEEKLTTYERSDFCALPRAVPIGEAMMAIVLSSALLEKTGGDSLAEIKTRYASLRRSHLDDLPMDGKPWRFGY